MFMNAANYGLPVALFAFGEAGLERAILFFAPQSLMAGTLAIYVASSGKLGVKQGLITVLRLPIFYAVVAALVLNPFKVSLPGLVEIPLDILADAAIPTMVIVLGIQLARASWKEDLVPAGAASVVRLLLSPLLALGVTLLSGDRRRYSADGGCPGRDAHGRVRNHTGHGVRRETSEGDQRRSAQHGGEPSYVDGFDLAGARVPVRGGLGQTGMRASPTPPPDCFAAFAMTRGVGVTEGVRWG